MLFFFAEFAFSVFVLIIFVILLLIFINSKKPNKKIKVLITSIFISLGILLCYLTIGDVLIPSVHINVIDNQPGNFKDTFEWRGHKYIEDGVAFFLIITSAAKIVAYNVSNNNFLGYLNADLVYEINNQDNELYMPIEMCGIKKFKKD